ncbi:unnamed protein product [Durusdinium trenchii]
MLELGRGESVQQALRHKRKLRGWRASIIHRCTMYIRCYKASLCERTLSLVQESTVSARQTWADARETNAMIASVRAQGIYILESFGNAGLSERFRMLWPPMQPWRQVFYFSFYSSKNERLARLLLRLALSALLAALARQLVFGAFSADAEDAAPEVCGQRPEGLAEVLPLALICHGIARLSSSLLDAACMLQRGCLCCRWVAVSQGL